MLSEVYVELESSLNLRRDMQSVLTQHWYPEYSPFNGAFAWVLTMASSFNPKPISYPFHMFLLIGGPFAGFGFFSHFVLFYAWLPQNYNLQLLTSNLDNYFVCVSILFSAVYLTRNNESFLLQSSVHPLLNTC